LSALRGARLAELSQSGTLIVVREPV